jgi:hypothetical protein
LEVKVELNNTDTKTCPFCAESIKLEAIICRYCGKTLQPSTPSFVSSNSKIPNQGIGLSLSSLILGVIGVVFGLIDYGGLQDGTYSFLNDQEIGTLGIVSLTAVGLGIGAAAKRQRIWVGALVVSIFSLLIMLVVAAQ